MKPAHHPGGGSRVVDLGGHASHTFEFEAPLALVQSYFADVPAIFKLLPDVMHVQTYAPDKYRVVVGASDHLGHMMAGIFDLQATFDGDYAMRLTPVKDGPAVTIKGFTFPGDLWLEITFEPVELGTIAQYALELSLAIPLPGPMARMPIQAVQKMGERAMSAKISHMITGFARHVQADFARFAHWTETTNEFGLR
jgi:hypothetical protein